MVELAPMYALRYGDAYADGRVYAPPYDVINDEQRRCLLGRSPYNVVHLILGGEPGDAAWHGRAAETMSRWIAAGVLVRDHHPSLYGYRQHFRDSSGRPRTRTGVMGRVRLCPWGGPIHRHEHTRIGPRLDRLRLTRAVRANLSPVFGLFRDPQGEICRLLPPPDEEGNPDLLVNVTDDDGVRHILWRVGEPDTIFALATAFLSREVIIADGHHRYETALAYQSERRRAEGDPPEARPYDYVLMYLSSVEDPGLCILPAHRIVRGAERIDPAGLLAALSADFEVEPVAAETSLAAAAAASDHTVTIGACLGAGERWLLRLKGPAMARRRSMFEGRGDLDALDVSVLQNLVLEKHLGIDAEILLGSDRLAYTVNEEEACAQVVAGEAQAAFILNATRIEQVWAAAERGLTMPQKSTYFYPKLLSGLVINPLDDG